MSWSERRSSTRADCRRLVGHRAWRLALGPDCERRERRARVARREALSAGTAPEPPTLDACEVGMVRRRVGAAKSPHAMAVAFCPFR